ncbi:hypothetical protein NDU88_003010 [Pleurodeles waltl]|uniref:Uncharacterized protein n=1 Tax=Pleurodeles waltl TaxID=8319 RepID=A0AAV7TPR6_PLEWA|nr:hypothetical protein NDU88_003010 [Pleurodeles waltl]
MPSKAWRKQNTEGKRLTSRHSRKNHDAMEPELHSLPMLMYLLIHQEHERRRRRPWSMLARKSFLGRLGREEGEGLGVEEEGVVLRGFSLLCLGAGAWAGCCCEVDGCWVSECLRLCTLGGGGTDTVGEDTGDVCMDVEVVTASEGRVVIGLLVMEVLDEDVVHAGVSVDATGREVDDEEEGDTVEAVDVGVGMGMVLM